MRARPGFDRFVVALALAACVARPNAAAGAQEPTPPPAGSPAPASCALLSADDVASLVGFAVQDPEDASRSSGVCFFAARSVSDDGSATYAIVSPADLPARRAYFAVLARRCAGVSAVAPRAAACATYARMASARDLGAYFEARTSGAASLAQLGDAAFATADAVYVKRGERVVEAVVMRQDAFDAALATKLAALVLARLPR